jgi:CheY-like chemotaxis protein
LWAGAISANSLPEDIERAMSAGFDDYITKPFAVARVLDLVDRLRRQAGLKADGLPQELLDRV